MGGVMSNQYLGLVKIIQFCLKMYDLWGHHHHYGGCMDGWVDQWVESCKITKNQINLDLIMIIQFCLVYGWLGKWVYHWLGSCQISKT